MVKKTQSVDISTELRNVLSILESLVNIQWLKQIGASLKRRKL